MKSCADGGGFDCDRSPAKANYTNCSLQEEAEYLFQERAAIYEYDANMSREEAERLARIDKDCNGKEKENEILRRNS